MLGAVLLLLVWLLLAFVAQVPSGAIHVLYAVSVILFGRRIIIGAPRFVS